VFYYCFVDHVGLETQTSSSPENSMPDQQKATVYDATDQFLDAPSFSATMKESSSQSSVSSPPIISPPCSPQPLYTHPITLDISSSEDLHQEVVTPTRKHQLYNKQSSYFSLIGTVDCLFIVVHGGTVLKSKLSKEYDKETITNTINKLMKSHFYGRGRVAIRMVSCQSLTAEVFQSLKDLKPDIISPLLAGEDHQSRSDSDDIDPEANLSCLPITLMAVLSTESKFYTKVLNEAISLANVQYTSFLQSEEGQGFNGQVNII